jgi:hypothetical protein
MVGHTVVAVGDISLFRFYYSLRPILLFANTDISTTKICLDTFTLAKSIMSRREYLILKMRATLCDIIVTACKTIGVRS